MSRSNLKPNLVDSLIKKRIIKTLKPVPQDYWAPTKTTFRSLFESIIKPNLFFIIFFIVILILLYYRYHDTKKKRKEESLDTTNKIVETDTFVEDFNIQCTDKKCVITPKIKNESNVLLSMYMKEKEKMREPYVKNIEREISSKEAYPTYPNILNKNLVPAKQR